MEARRPRRFRCERGMRLLRAACPYMVTYVTRPAPYLTRRPGVPAYARPMEPECAPLLYALSLSSFPLHKQTTTTSSTNTTSSTIR